MPDFRAIAAALETTARLMESRPELDPDGAVRMAIWGTPEAMLPAEDTTDSLLYDDAVSAIECYDADKNGYDPGDGIQRLDRSAAIEAARVEARRFRSYC